MRISFMAIPILSCNCNQKQHNQTEEVQASDSCFMYPIVIDSLHLTDLYDSARWYVYAWYCDQIYLSKRDTTESKTFGELSLKFSGLTLKGDTIEIKFDFIDEHENHPILPSITRNTTQFLSGVGFSLSTKRKIYMLSPDGFTTVVKGGANRYENPL